MSAVQDSNAIILHRGVLPSVSLAEAVAAAGTTLEGAVAFLYTPAAFVMGKLESGEVRQPGGTAGLERVFEARLFNETCELRWLHKRDGRGRGVLLSEQALPPAWQAGADAPEFAARYWTSYLLWGVALAGGAGDASGLPTGWTTLFEARTGPMRVPIHCPPKRRVLLIACEYIQRADHGNAAVAEERLVGLVAGDCLAGDREAENWRAALARGSAGQEVQR